MWHKPCWTFHPWCLCIKTRCLCMEVNAVMRCPNVVNTAMLTKQALGWGRVLRGSRGPSSPWGRVLHGADFSMGPSFVLGRVLRGAEFSGIHKDTQHTGKMAAVSSSKGHKSSRLLRPVADSDYDSLSEIASELNNLPRNSFVNGYKFFADWINFFPKID